jgi:hypothetical protein
LYRRLYAAKDSKVQYPSISLSLLIRAYSATA